MTAETSRLTKLTAWTLVVAPVVLFYGILARLVTPVPNEDDYDAMLGWALHWHAASNLPQHLALLGGQHNEYKLFLQNLLLSLELRFTHHINFGLWIWVGNALVMVCLVPLWRSCVPRQPLTIRLLLFAPVVWIFINLDYAETLDWALSGMQEVAVLALGLNCVYFATQASMRKNAWSCVLAIVACAAYANAFMLAPIGLALFSQKKRRGILVLWTASFLMMLLLYLHRYIYLSHPLSSLSHYLLYFPAVMGSAFGFHRSLAMATLAGLLMLGSFLYFTVRRFDLSQPFAYWSTAWLFTTFLLTTYGRTWMGVESALVSRYRIYSCLAMALLYLLALADAERRTHSPSSKKKLYVGVLVATVLFGLMSDAYGYRLLNNRRTWLLYGMRHYVASHGTESPMTYSANPTPIMDRPVAERRVRNILTDARAGGIYRVPEQY